MSMDARERNVLSLCLALLVFSLVYALNPPGPRYYPLEGVWRWENLKGIPSMAWYARVVYAACGAAAAYALGRLATGALTLPGRTPAAAISTVLVAFALVAASAYLAWVEYHHWVAP